MKCPPVMKTWPVGNYTIHSHLNTIEPSMCYWSSNIFPWNFPYFSFVSSHVWWQRMVETGGHWGPLGAWGSPNQKMGGFQWENLRKIGKNMEKCSVNGGWFVNSSMKWRLLEATRVDPSFVEQPLEIITLNYDDIWQSNFKHIKYPIPPSLTEATIALAPSVR